MAFVRLALGIPMLISGVGKVLAIGPKPMGISGFAGFLTSLGVPFPTVAAWGVGLIELVGGLLLVVGVAVRVVSALIAVDMVVATVLYHLPNGYPAGSNGIELTLVLTLIAAALVLSGPGTLSVEHALFDQEDSSFDSSQSRGAHK
ncbi:DoxX family protein [Haloferax sp. ATB1]|uniref:DoxX family protein n=1 Tax=Haloferax sp. ATB1 TaxID=1508454 RepID=UPI001F525367|nr:DoxX family protein [Haloferax sp. ATB1]